MSSADRLYDPRGVNTGNFRVLDSVKADLDDETLRQLQQRVHGALKDFPELDGTTVTVAKMDPDKGYYAWADWINDIIHVPTYELCPWITIYHELGHLAIRVLNDRGEDVPITSEEFCSIFSVARMPADRIDRSRIAYLGYPSIPREEWPETCQRALDYRENNHNYVQKCTEWLGTDVDEGGDHDGE